jgi:hypothetical protein
MVTFCMPALPDVTVPDMLWVDCDELVGFAGFVVPVPDPVPPAPQPVKPVTVKIKRATHEK